MSISGLFLLFFLGRCLFANATGNRASSTLIRFVQDLDKVGDYAWGAATLAFLFHSLDSRCRVQPECKSLRGFVSILQVWVWEHIVLCRPERLPARLSCIPRASQWYPNANLRGFTDILPPEMTERIKALGMKLGEQGYRFILNELRNHEVIWQPYQGEPDDEMAVVQEGRGGCQLEQGICRRAHHLKDNARSAARKKKRSLMHWQILMRERDMPEAMRIHLESDFLTMLAEVDRLQAELHSECDRAFTERVASAAQVDELRTKFRSFEALAHRGVIVASVPPPLSLSEERALIHDQYAERIDRMQ